MAEPNQSQLAIKAARSALVDRAVFAALALVVISSAVATKRFSGAPVLAAIERSGTQPSEPIAQPTQALSAEQTDPWRVLREYLDNGSATESSPESADTPSTTTNDASVRYFDGRPIRPVRRMWMTVTAYSPDARSCGEFADGRTASMKSVWTNGGCLVAADSKVLPIGSLVTVPGYAGDMVVPVLDRGGKIKGTRLDVLYPTHEIALSWGVQRLPVTVWEYADDAAH
ncbi:MAG: 3D domain-containing protein [Phycisphaeraceae bacterium]|nr:3D domain-containing protein [Phycisphaerales bacterium]MCB9843757.1 3D domain-containing protein [Phycisphaeraceae bacterium]